MKKSLYSLLAFSAICCTYLALQTNSVNVVAEELSETVQLSPAYYTLALEEYTVPDFEDVESIISPNGEEVQMVNGVFRPLSVGEYTIRYKEKTETLNVLLHSFAMQFDIADTFEDTYFVGEKIYIPIAKATDVFTSYSSYSVSVSCDGKNQAFFENVEAKELVFSLASKGEYLIEYVFTDVLGGTQTQGYTFTVKSEPVIMCDKIEPYVSYESVVYLGVSYGYYEKDFYETVVSIITPNGEKETVTDIYYHPQTLGEYTVVYETNVNGTMVTKEQSFEVYYTPANYLHVSEKATVAIRQDLPSYVKNADKQTGLSVSSLSSDTFYYKPIVNLRTLTKEDTLISFYTQASTKAVTNIYVYLTDIYDPSNVISIRFYRNEWNMKHSYLVVSRAKNSYGISNESATKGQIRKTYGTVAYDCSMLPNTYGTSLFNLQYDGETDGLYSVIQGVQYKVLDLCSEELDFVDRFYGFTTGEVYMSVKLNNPSGIYLQELVGMDVSQISATEYDLGENYIVFDEYYTTRPMPVKGYIYKIPTVKTSPVCGETLTITYNVFDENGKEVNIIDGTFTPTSAGEYKIVYSSPLKDLQIQKTLVLTVKNKPDEIQAELPNNESVRAGDYYLLPKIAVSGGEGVYTYTYKLYNNAGEYTVDEFGRYFVDTKDNVTVEMTVRDYVGFEKTFTYALNVNKDVSVLVIDDKLPNVVREGSLLSLPTFSATDYRTGESLEKALVINGNVVVLTEETYTLTVPACEMLTIRFVGGLGTDAETDVEKYSYTLRVIPKQSIQTDLIEFDTKKTDIIYLENGITFVSKTEGEASVSFPYALPANGLALKFAVGGTALQSSSVLLSFTDGNNSEQALAFRLSEWNMSKSTAKIEQIGVGEKYEISGLKGLYTENCGADEYKDKYVGKEYYVFDILFYAPDGSIRTTSDMEIIRAKTYTNGLSYKGFLSGLTYVGLTMESADVDFELSVDTLGNQRFNYQISINPLFTDCDNIGPMLKTENPLVSCTRPHGAMYSVEHATAHDVLQGNGTVRITVVAPSGDKVINNAPSTNMLAFALTEYGYYKIQYVATDAIGKKSTKEIKILVKNETEPVFSLGGDYKNEYKVGEKLTVLTASVSNREDAEIRILIKKPDSHYVFMNTADTFVLDTLGEYEIIYLIYDSSNNITAKPYSFEVKV